MAITSEFNGFSGGLVAIVLYPILTSLVKHRRPVQKRKNFFFMVFLPCFATVRRKLLNFFLLLQSIMGRRPLIVHCVFLWQKTMNIL